MDSLAVSSMGKVGTFTFVYPVLSPEKVPSEYLLRNEF